MKKVWFVLIVLAVIFGLNLVTLILSKIHSQLFLGALIFCAGVALVVISNPRGLITRR